MKFRRLFSSRSFTNINKSTRNRPNSCAPLYNQNAYITSTSSSLQDLTFKNPMTWKPISTNTIALFTRNVHSLQVATPVETDDSDIEDGPMTEFLSRFVWIMRSKLADAYPDCDKPTINGMLLIIVEKVVEELEKGGIEEMLGEMSSTPSDYFSEDLWKTVWEVSNTVLDDMKKARKKEEMKKYIQSEEVKEMCKFASEVGVRGNMLREFRFKWAKEKMEEVEFYQSLDHLRDEARAQEREEEEMNRGEEVVDTQEQEGESLAEEGSDLSSEVKPKIVSLPQRRGKIKYKIYGLDLSDPKWAEVANKIHESEKLVVAEEPKPITGKSKLVTEEILNLTEGDDPLTLLAEWVELLDPARVDWFALLDKLKQRSTGLYFKVAEILLDEESFKANIRDYSKLIEAHSNENRLSDAERIIDKMTKKNIKPDILTSTILVHMYSKANNLPLAKHSFENLRSLGFQPDTRAYTSMISAYINSGDPKSGESLLREMEARDIKPAKEMYMSLLKAFAERGQFDGAHRIATTMQFAGIQHSLESCTLLVEAYAKAGDVDRARENFDYMIKRGHKPDDRCMAGMLSVYSKKNSLDKALNLLLKHEADGFKPGVGTYTVLADWFSKLVLINEVEELVKKIKDSGGPIPVKVQVGLCAMYAKARDEKKALQALGVLEGKMEELGSEDFERVVSGLIDGGLVHEALRVHEIMKGRGFIASEMLRVSLMAADVKKIQSEKMVGRGGVNQRGFRR